MADVEELSSELSTLSVASEAEDCCDDDEADDTRSLASSASGLTTPRLHHLTEGLEKLWVTGAHSDITIMVENRVFKCHKAVLFATSPYFDAMFSSGMRESVSGEITFKEMEADTFELVMEYIYTGKEVVTQANVIKLLKASSLLQIKSLCEKCEVILEPYIDVENCIDIWRLSLIHCWEKVKARAIKKIHKHFVALIKTDAFMRLDAYEIIQILKHDNLEVSDEETVLEAVFLWARRGDPAVRKQKLGQIFANVRLGHISAERLSLLKSPNSPVIDDPLAQQYIDEAIQYKLLPARRQEANSQVTHYRRCSQFDEVLVVMGGCMSMHPPYKRCNDVLGYSFAQEKWFKLESLPFDPGIEFATCTYGNDICLTGGGSRTQTFLKYRSDKNKWKIGKPLCQGRRRHVMASLTNSLYVIGGYDHRLPEGNRMLASIEKFDMSEDSWEEVSQLPTPVSSFSSAVSGERILLFGGEKNDKTDTGIVQCFDTRTNQCTNLNSLTIISKLTKAVTSGRRIFIIFFSGKIVEYNPNATNSQSCNLVGTVKSFRRIHYGAVQYRGKIFIVGGENEDTSLTREMIVVKSDSGEAEKSVVPLPNARLIDSCVKIAINKRFLTEEKVEDYDQNADGSTTPADDNH
ncbi:kelch-like protein 24 isoform X2 [Dreissena polymorpha]|uniref:kelch-like protein 24 isoform X2 n=1 Tax=Dreissena polymorpha TaxID=45954 RepID=UPI002264480A|nr:kelch-like protein 24 isoform X2 [Dreissena polymorpha]